MLHAGSVPGWVSAVPNSGLDKFAWLFFCFLLQTVKVADFGVARVKAQSGVMTAETGTYRWMAPEVFFFVISLATSIILPLPMFILKKCGR